MALRFVKVDERHANFDEQAVLQLLSGDSHNLVVRLPLPHEQRWSGPMSGEEAAALADREAVFSKEEGLVEVIDPDNLWPAHWQPIET